MFPTYRDLLIRQEQLKDRLRAAERERRFAPAAGPITTSPVHRQAASWLGTQLIGWGHKLQSYGAAPTMRLSEQK